MQAVFFDLDGTLADSLPALYNCYQSFLQSFDVVGSRAEFASLNGPVLRDVVARLRATHHLPVTHELAEKKYWELLQHAYQDTIVPHAGVGECLARCRTYHVRIGVVTSAPVEFAQLFLTRHGLSALVDGVISALQVAAGKPDPAVYRAALQYFATTAPHTVAIEDSVAGLQSATAAGIPVIHFCPDATSGASAKSFSELTQRLEELLR